MREDILQAKAYTKLNVGLAVRPRDRSGLHPIQGLFLSVDHHDRLAMQESDEDVLHVSGAVVPTEGDNLVWKAVHALREACGVLMPVTINLTKRIPVAAGLGGGSADAAAALLLYQKLAVTGAGAVGVNLDDVARRVGSDVLFCLHGGLRQVDGYGERLGPALPVPQDFAVVVAVPPIMLETARVYQTWDELRDPKPLVVAEKFLPPSLRLYGPAANGLYPAAVACAPELADWRSELSEKWGVPVLMSGSGPSLFSFFADRQEAEQAATLVDRSARSVFFASPVVQGTLIEAG